jgi:hypothetical protein
LSFGSAEQLTRPIIGRLARLASARAWATARAFGMAREFSRCSAILAPKRLKARSQRQRAATANLLERIPS